MSAPVALADTFFTAFGHAPEGFSFASGRVNLIGEHVDYNDGLVLPMPIPGGTWVAWSRRDDTRIEATAVDFGRETASFVPGDGGPYASGHWAAYLRGMAESCSARGLALPGANLAIAGTMPRGAGLSSSASLCIAIGRALAAAGLEAGDQLGLALAAQATEHAYAGVRCGLMDQMAIALGKPREALLLDCRSLATRSVPLPLHWAVMVVPSGVSRGLVEGCYNERRGDCEAAAAALGVASLRDASSDAIRTAGLDPVSAARATHVVEEIARTSAAAKAICSADLVALGELMRASHASLRDLFEVSTPQVDALVDVLNRAIGPAGGARMTGGGFGGAVVAILERSAVDSVKSILHREHPGLRHCDSRIMIL